MAKEYKKTQRNKIDEYPTKLFEVLTSNFGSDSSQLQGNTHQCCWSKTTNQIDISRCSCCNPSQSAALTPYQQMQRLLRFDMFCNILLQGEQKNFTLKYHMVLQIKSQILKIKDQN